MTLPSRTRARPAVLARLRSKVRVGLLKGSQYLESTLTRWRLPGQPTAHESRIIRDLKTEGVHVTTIDRLLHESALAPNGVIARAAALLHSEPAREHSAIWAAALASTDLRAEVLLARVPEIFLLGLDSCILQLAQRYLGLPVAYHGAVLRNSLVDGKSAGPRLWHQDCEDFHVLRIVLYLTDVTSDSGPFEYVPRRLGIGYAHFPGEESDLTDSRMAAVVPKERWKRCTGPAGTVVLCDTGKVFHHESLQKAQERAVVMFGYSSRRPKNIQNAMMHFPVERVRAALMQIVPPENYGHVFGWRRQAL